MPDQQKHRTLSPRQLHSWIGEKKSFYLIGTLLADHFQKVHLPGAVNACVFQVIFIDEIHKIIQNKAIPIVVYGSSSRSMDAVCAAQKLSDNGYKDVYVLEGGISAWRKAGLPLEGEKVGESDDPETLLSIENRSYTSRQVSKQYHVVGEKFQYNPLWKSKNRRRLTKRH